MSTTDVMRTQAADLTAEEWEDRKKTAYAIHERVLQGVMAGRASAWALAGALYQFSQESAWAALGYESLNQYLADPEVNVSRTTYFRYVSCWLEFVERRGLEVDDLMDIDLTKADVVLAALRDGKVTVDKALADVRALPAGDLRIQYGAKPKPQAPTPSPAPKPTDGTEGEQDEGTDAVTADNLATTPEATSDQVSEDVSSLAAGAASNGSQPVEAPAPTPTAESPQETAQGVAEAEDEDEPLSGVVVVSPPPSYEADLTDLMNELDGLRQDNDLARAALRNIMEVWKPLSHKRIPTALNIAITDAAALAFNEHLGE